MTPKHKTALRIFQRDNFTCQYCGRQYPPEQAPLHKHHRVFTSQGGKDDLDNLATCCWECHHNHGELKGKRLRHEKDDSKINELRDRYKTR